MRRKIIIVLLSFLPLTSLAQPAKTETFIKKSEVLLKESAKLPLSEKSKKLLDLRTQMQQSLDEYRKTNQGNPSDEEWNLSSLFVALRPVFKIAESKKSDAKVCEQADFDIRHDNRKDNVSDAVTKNGQIALDWLKLFCK